MHQEFLRMLALQAMEKRTPEQETELTKLTEKYAVLAATWTAVPTPTSYNGSAIDVTSKATWKLNDGTLKGKALTEALIQLESFCKVPAETQLEAIPFGSVLTDRGRPANHTGGHSVHGHTTDTADAGLASGEAIHLSF